MYKYENERSTDHSGDAAESRVHWLHPSNVLTTLATVALLSTTDSLLAPLLLASVPVDST